MTKIRCFLIALLFLGLISCGKKDSPVEGFWTGRFTREGSVRNLPARLQVNGETTCYILRHRGADLTIDLEGTYPNGSSVQMISSGKTQEIPTENGKFRLRWIKKASELGSIPWIQIRFFQPGVVLDSFHIQENKNFPKTIFLALDGSTWRIMNKLIEENRLPHFQKLMKKGSYGELVSIEPTLSPVVWTSIASGKTPEEHGIRHFLDENEIPVHSGEIQVPRAWNIFSEKTQLTMGILGWFVTWPVEAVNGFMISDRAFQKEMKIEEDQLSYNPAVLNPFFHSLLEERKKNYIQECSRFTSLKLDPQYQQLDPKSLIYRWHKILDIRLFPVYYRDSSYIQAALKLYPALQPDLLFLYLRGNDFTQHTYWFYTFPEESDQSMKAKGLPYFKDIIRNYYIYLDEMIGRFMELAPKDTTFIIVSDHGFKTQTKGKPGHERKISYHEKEGIYIVSGPAFKKDFRKNGLSIYDICPLLLYSYGLPVAKDMAGHVPIDLWRGFLPPKKPVVISTYGKRQKSHTDSIHSGADQEIIEQLKSLGYIEGD